MGQGEEVPACVPTRRGHVETTKDALRIFQACFNGILPCLEVTASRGEVALTPVFCQWPLHEPDPSKDDERKNEMNIPIKDLSSLKEGENSNVKKACELKLFMLVTQRFRLTRWNR